MGIIALISLNFKVTFLNNDIMAMKNVFQKANPEGLQNWSML